MADLITVPPRQIARFRRACDNGANPYLVWTGRAVRIFYTDQWRAMCYTGAFIITTRDDLTTGNPDALDLPDESLAAALTDLANDRLAERDDLAPAT